MRKLNFTKDAMVIKILLSVLIASIFCFTIVCESNILNWFGNKDFFATLSGDFQICFINVGQGDCTFVRYKDTTFVIDAGDKDNAEIATSVIGGICKDNEIDYFILTHPDSDHTGGAEAVFERFHVKNFYRPKMLTSEEVAEFGNEDNYGVYDTAAYLGAITAGYEEGCDINYIKMEKFFEDEDFSFEVLYPFSDDDLDKSDTNSYSAIIRLEYKGFSYLLMADADKEIEEKLVNRYGDDLRCNVLKVSHHGSKTGTSDLLLSRTFPSYAIISVGQKGLKEYGHASDEFKDRLKNEGITTYQTSIDGHIMFGENDNLLVVFDKVPQLSYALISAICLILLLLVWAIRVKREEKKE